MAYNSAELIENMSGRQRAFDVEGEWENAVLTWLFLLEASVKMRSK